MIPRWFKGLMIGESDRRLLNTYMGDNSKRHGEPFVRGAGGNEYEIWYLAPYCLGRKREQAVSDLRKYYELTEEEGIAAWLYCWLNPQKAKILNEKHTDSTGFENMLT